MIFLWHSNLRISCSSMKERHTQSIEITEENICYNRRETKIRWWIIFRLLPKLAQATGRGTNTWKKTRPSLDGPHAFLVLLSSSCPHSESSVSHSDLNTAKDPCYFTLRITSILLLFVIFVLLNENYNYSANYICD